MTPLVVEFKTVGATVIMKVLSQDESTRGKQVIFTSSEGFELKSMYFPDPWPANKLFLRGTNKNKDIDWSIPHTHDSPRAAVEYIEKAERAIHEYNESIKEKKQMEKFRFRVWRNDYTVTMKIFEQPEETRGKGMLFKHNGVEIYSMDCPQIDGDCIFIRGAILAKDNRAATISFDSLDEAEAYRKKITEALNAYAKRLEEQTTPKCADKLVYQFDRIGCVVVATPIHIPEWVVKYPVYYSESGFKIRNTSFPHIGFNLFYIFKEKGITKNIQCFFNFRKEEEAIQWIKEAAKAITEYNAKYAPGIGAKTDPILWETVIAE